MAMRKRKQAKNAIAKPKLMTALFPGKCKCGKPIVAGDTIYYESRRKALCFSCGNKETQMAKAGISEVTEPSPTQKLIDRFRELESLPSPLSLEAHEELLGIIKKMTVAMAGDRVVHQFVRSKVRCTNKEVDLRPFQLRSEGWCVHCNVIIRREHLALYDVKGRRIHCVQCDLVRHYLAGEPPCSTLQPPVTVSF